MRKKLILISVFILCVIFLGGCANVNYGVTVCEDGSVKQEVNVAIERNEIVLNNMEILKLEEDITAYANAVVYDLYTQFLNRETTTDEMKIVVQQSISPNNGTAEVKTSLDKNYLYVNMSLKFTNITAYNYFYGIEETEEDEAIYEDNVFYVKEISEGKTVFHNLANTSIAKYWLDYFKPYGYTLNDATYIYSYSTPYNHLYSNSDYTMADGVNKVHVWNFSADDLAKENGDLISIYTVKFRPVVWYGTALALTTILISVLIVIAVIQEKKKKRKQKLNINLDIKM